VAVSYERGTPVDYAVSKRTPSSGNSMLNTESHVSVLGTRSGPVECLGRHQHSSWPRSSQQSFSNDRMLLSRMSFTQHADLRERDRS